MAHLPRLDAQRAIKEGNFEPTDPDAVRRLYLRAFENEAIADKAYSRAVQMLADLKQGK